MSTHYLNYGVFFKKKISNQESESRSTRAPKNEPNQF